MTIFGDFHTLLHTGFWRHTFKKRKHEKKFFFFWALLRTGFSEKPDFFPPEKSDFLTFQHTIPEMRFFEGAFQWYYIDSSPTFIPYIKVLQTDHFGEILEPIWYGGFE